MTVTCTVCGTAEDVASFGLCPACLTSTTEAEVTAQGLPPKVTDPRALDPIATVLAHTSEADSPAA